MAFVSSFKPTMAFVKGLIFVLLSFSVTAQASTTASACKVLLSEIEYDVDVADGEDMGQVNAYIGDSPETVGFIEYNYNSKDKSVYISIMMVEPEAKKTGIGSGLFTQVVSQHPEAALVDATLAMDNFAAFREALKNNKTVEEALQQTPFYKMASRNGFTKIIMRDTDNPKNYDKRKDIEVTFARPEKLRH